MNILVVCHYGMYKRPESSFIHAQAREYVKMGQRVRVIIPVALGKSAWNQGKWKAKPEIVDGVELFPVRYISLSRFGKKHFNSASAIWMINAHKRQLLAGFVPDVIHAHTIGFDNDIGAWLKKETLAPLVVTTHGSDTFVPNLKGELGRFKSSCDQADRLVAVSSLLQRTLEKSGTVTPILVILNGFQCENAVDRGEKKPLSFLQAGSLIPRKCVDITLHSFADIYRSDAKATLTIVGEGPEREKLEELAQQLGIQKAVRFLGQIPNRQLLCEMAAHQFFVMPSVREGFGIVYLEAMASSCITIGVQGEGISDFICHGKNGFLVPPYQPEAITGVVTWCRCHPEQATAIAQQGYRDACKMTWNENAGQYLKLFKELLKHGNTNAK